MRASRDIMRRMIVIALLGSLTLAGLACGQKGPLYLPEEPAEEEEKETKKKN